MTTGILLIDSEWVRGFTGSFDDGKLTARLELPRSSLIRMFAEGGFERVYVLLPRRGIDRDIQMTVQEGGDVRAVEAHGADGFDVPLTFPNVVTLIEDPVIIGAFRPGKGREESSDADTVKMVEQMVTESLYFGAPRLTVRGERAGNPCSLLILTSRKSVLPGVQLAKFQF